MDIHRSHIKNFILPKVKSVYLIDYYEGIQGILTGREDFSYKELLANPRVRNQNEIIWSTEAFHKKPVLLCNLSDYEKQKYSYLLNQCIHSIESLIDSIKEEEGGQSLSELLNKLIPYIDESSVYCGEDKIVLVNWGLIPRIPDQTGGQIYRSGKFIENWDKRHLIPPIVKPAIPINETQPEITSQPDIDLVDETPKVIEETTDIETPKVDNEEKDTPPIADTINKEEEIQEESVIEEDKADTTNKADEVDETAVVDKEEEAKEETKENVTEEKSPSETEPVKTEKHDENNYGWNTLFRNFWQGIKFLFKRLLWILVSVALFLLAMYLLKDCQGPIHRINPYYNPLPEKSIILPVENTSIGKSSDGTNDILTDRLNVIIEPENENTMLEWAKAFKKIYNKKEYEIFYYNKELNHLQIRIPADEHETIKNNLPNQIPQIRFEVFDELIQGSGVHINDPMYNDPEHSWYLSPIGAEEAWDVTLGDEDIVIAVVDNGFDKRHPEFEGRVSSSYNVLTQNSYVRPILTKYGIDPHGTHVAATASGNYNNNCGLLGIAPKCKLMLIQVGNDNYDGCLSSTAIREGVMYAINQGADVVNVSLGMNIPQYMQGMSEGAQLNYINNTYRQEELLWEHVYSKAKKNNCVIVFAAGNENVISGIDPKKRSKNVIKVSAVNKKLKKADFSNYGVYPELNREYSTLSAPGVMIYNAAPDEQYTTMDGTSMAAPIVSGAVALLKSVDKNLTNDQIVSLLKKTGEKVGKNIGPMINIGRALKAIDGNDDSYDKCGKIKREIEILKAQIDSLTQLCPDAALPADTLKYENVINDPKGLDGLWKSTTELFATTDETPVELYMSFKDLKGTLSIVNKGDTYTAQLEARIADGKIYISQDGPARCGENTFSQYSYECKEDIKGYLQCIATCIDSKIIFNLVKIK